MIYKEGSTISGLMDSFATAISYNLQYGVPLKFLVDKFGHVRFEPSGGTGNQQIPYAKSIPDHIFRWLSSKFLGDGLFGRGSRGESEYAPDGDRSAGDAAISGGGFRRAALCGVRRDMTRNGSCYKCGNCGGPSGCS